MTIGAGDKKATLGHENQRLAMSAFISGVQTLTMRIAASTPTSAAAAEPARPLLQIAFGLQHQPAGPEQGVAEQQGHAGEERERRQEVERAADELPPFDLKALDEGAEHDALGEGGDRRPVAEPMVP